MATVSEVLTRAAAKLDAGVCRGANARLGDGKACGVFDQRAASYSMYGALCSVLGPGLGGDKALQASPAWKLITLRAWDAIPEGERGGMMRYALHELSDDLKGSMGHGMLFRSWAADAEIKALGEWS